MSYQPTLNDNAKKIAIILIGVIAAMSIISAFDLPKDQVCREIPNYSEQAHTDSHMYDSDPYRQLGVFREEFGSSWAGGHYEEQEDLLSVCMLKEQRVWDFFE